MRCLLTENHNGDLDCSRVLPSISRHIFGVTSSVFLRAVTVVLRLLTSGRFLLQGHRGVSRWNFSSNKSEIQSCSPLILRNRSGSRELTCPRNLSGLGSKSSTGLTFLLTGFEYWCFSKVASDSHKLLSFPFQGGFHWHRRDVHGTGSFVSVSPSEAMLGSVGFKVERACNKADTCVQLADCLQTTKQSYVKAQQQCTFILTQQDIHM